MLSNEIIRSAQNVERKTGIPTAIILGQALLESGSNLNSGLVTKGNNLFGIKGTGTNGSIYLPTKEEVNGRMVTVNAQFRKYNNLEESILDHAKLLSLPRYSKYLSQADSVEEFAQGIKSGGYATDSNYVSKLLGVIASNRLADLNVNKKITFDPSSVKNLSYGFGGLYDPDKPKDEQGFLNDLTSGSGLLFSGSRLLILLILFLIGIYFFVKAFSIDKIAEDTTGAVLNTVGKVNKGISAVNQVRKAVK